MSRIVRQLGLFAVAFMGLPLLPLMGGDAPSASKEVHIDLGGGVSFDLVRIEPGTCTIGSPPTEPARRDNENQHVIRITKPFYLGKHELTQAVWERVMTARIKETLGKTNSFGLYWAPGDSLDISCNARPSKFVDPAGPVDSISWRECKEFIARLNLLVDGAGFRLPTEAEWEYAARAGTSTACCFGNESSALGGDAWYKPNSGGKTHPVGTMRPNPWGLYDMYGNVWEWCEDAYVGPHSFPNTEIIEDYCNRGSEGGTRYQVIRGGSFDFSARLCRSASRSGFDPWQHAPDVGFRLARTVEEK